MKANTSSHSRILTFVLLLSVPNLLQAQEGEYRSASNPFYWKNRMPNVAYWQQDVHYVIRATLDDKTDIVDGVESLTYYNNSPDTLRVLYFHLYQNAFQPGSYLAQLEKANGIKSEFGKYEAQKLGTTISHVTIDRVTLQPFFDNTIMGVTLQAPLLPGRSVQVAVVFKSYFDKGSMRRRMKLFENFGYKHFDCVHWYPRICVYDRKFGWETDQHLGKEFYGDFGSYDVELTLPSHYVLEATGKLMNKDEALPATYREKIDIKNFKALPKNAEGKYTPNACNPADGKTKTWKFKALNVHDFAWTADPLYRVIETEWNGVQCVGLAEEFNAPYWQDAAEFVASVVKLYSEDIGMYAYPKMVAADARDGMEYPMLTLDGGTSPGYHGVIAHEIGHNWFFGMIGNNETYRAALDEGFTQFLTGWSLTKLDGKYPLSGKSRSKWHNKYREQNPTVVNSVYIGYLQDAMNWDDEPLNTHSDQFNGALGHGGGYRHVYYKTATMLYNLQYVLGDELFLKAMQHYFNQWKICHPYFEDFRSSIINYTHVDLNWFFDQWMETTKRNDYSIVKVRKAKQKDTKGGYNYNVTINRNERMQMPLDIAVITNTNDTFWYNISNTYFHKLEPYRWLLVPFKNGFWKGWDNLNETYKLNFSINVKAKNIIIDPTHRMADINYLNNSWKCPVKWKLDAQVALPKDLYRYRIFWRPDIWGNAVDGVQAGLHFKGGYMDFKHVFEATAWVNTGLMANANLGGSTPVSWWLEYRNRIAKNTNWQLKSQMLAGFAVNVLGLTKTIPSGKSYGITIKSIYNAYTLNNSSVLLLPYAKGMNNTLNLHVGNQKLYNGQKGYVTCELSGRASLFSDYNYSWLQLKSHNQNNMGKLILKTRFIGRLGSNNSVAPESQLMLSGASTEDILDNKFMRSVGFFPINNDAGNIDFGALPGNLQMGGGLNLRGYTGYAAPELVNNKVLKSYAGKGGWAVNAELEFDQFIKIKPRITRNWLKVNTYVFADAGQINYQTTTNMWGLGSVRADAGLGTTFTIKRFGALDEVKPFTLRFDFPLYLSNAPAGKENIAFRWMVGVNRAW